MCYGKKREGDGINEPYHWIGTRKFVALRADKCLFCSKEGTCLWVDNSDAEYNPIALCFDCIKGFFVNLSVPNPPEEKQYS